MHNRSLQRPRHQRGTTLLEALVAFLVLSLGMLSVARMQTQMRLHADVARQRSEAVRLAQEDIESLRAFTVLVAAPGARSFEDIASATRTVDAGSGYATNTHYRVARQIDASATPHAKNALVSVSWTDRSGGAQQVALSSVIAGNDPAYSGALGLARGGVAAKGPFGRSVRIPLNAKDLGDGRSAFKPVGSGTVAFVFDNHSGLLTGRCAAVDPITVTRDLTPGNLGACDADVGHLLSGIVRFSSASPPDAAHGNDLPPAFTIAMAMSGGSYRLAPACSVEPVTTANGDRFAAYHCAVYPLANGQWSGRATLLPRGWTIGTAAVDHRVCRYSSDLDGSGAIGANIEHPASYAGVDTSLADQNFLVVTGNQACPTGRAIQVAGHNGDVYVNLSTAQHQP